MVGSGAGVFYPYNRGLLYTAQIVLYAMTAGIGGYTSAHLFRQMGGDRWARHLLLTCVIFAGPFFLMFCVLNTVAITYRCSAALLILHQTLSVPHACIHLPELKKYTSIHVELSRSSAPKSCMNVQHDRYLY